MHTDLGGGRTVEAVGARLGLSPLTVYAQVRDFKAALDREEPPAFFVDAVRGPKGARKKPRIVEHVLRLRARGYAGSGAARAGAVAVSVVQRRGSHGTRRAEGGMGSGLAITHFELKNQGVRSCNQTFWTGASVGATYDAGDNPLTKVG